MKEKWKEVCVSSGEHLQRVKEMYEELGFEILLEEMDPESINGCHECYKKGEKMFKLYVKQKDEN